MMLVMTYRVWADHLAANSVCSLSPPGRGSTPSLPH